MASVHDIAAYILDRLGSMTAMKLQKLVYYAQAWSLVWDEQPLFEAQIQAWANGPVVYELYQRHRGQFVVGPDWPGNPNALQDRERETVNAVLKFYGERSAHWLSELSHREAPWRDAREGLQPGERSSQTITHAAMQEYYSSLS